MTKFVDNSRIRAPDVLAADRGVVPVRETHRSDKIHAAEIVSVVVVVAVVVAVTLLAISETVCTELPIYIYDKSV